MTFAQYCFSNQEQPTFGARSNSKTTSTSATATDAMTSSFHNLALAAAAAAASDASSPSVVNNYRFGVSWSPSSRAEAEAAAEAAAVVVPSPSPIHVHVPSPIHVLHLDTQPTPSSTSINTGSVHDGFGLPAESTERHVDRPEIETAKSMKINASFFQMFPLLREMLIELHMQLFMHASHSHQVKWVDVVGDKRKKQRNGQFKVAAKELLSSTDTAMSLGWNDHELAVMTAKVQNWVKYFRRRHKKNSLFGWQKMMFTDLESSLGIKIL